MSQGHTVEVDSEMGSKKKGNVPRPPNIKKNCGLSACSQAKSAVLAAVITVLWPIDASCISCAPVQSLTVQWIIYDRRSPHSAANWHLESCCTSATVRDAKICSSFYGSPSGLAGPP